MVLNEGKKMGILFIIFILFSLVFYSNVSDLSSFKSRNFFFSMPFYIYIFLDIIERKFRNQCFIVNSFF